MGKFTTKVKANSLAEAKRKLKQKYGKKVIISSTREIEHRKYTSGHYRKKLYVANKVLSKAEKEKRKKLVIYAGPYGKGK